MNLNYESIIENASAAGVGLIPLVVLSGLNAPPGAEDAWARATGNLLAAAASVLICWTVWRFLKNRELGHRWLNILVMTLFGIRAIVHVWVTFNSLVGLSHIPVVMSVLSNSAEVAFGLFFFTSRGDLETTFKRSEQQRRANVKRLVNIEQRAMNSEWLVQKQSEKSRDLSERLENVGRGA